MRRVRVVEVSVNADELEIREEDIRIRMATLNESERIRASHILVGAPEDVELTLGEEQYDPDEDARKRASDILNMVREGGGFC